MTPQEIVSEIYKHLSFFQKNWIEFCESAERVAKQCHKYLDEQTGDYYRVAEMLHPGEHAIHKLMKKAKDRETEGQRHGGEARHGSSPVKVPDSRTGDSRDEAGKALDELHHRLQDQLTKMEDKDHDLEKQGWVRVSGYDHLSYSFFSLPFARPFRVPPDFVNPITWVFGFRLTREPSTEERLLCDCALLTVLHDFRISGSEPHICTMGPCCTSENSGQTRLEGRYFNCGDTLRPDNRTGFVWHLREKLNAMDKDGELERAWKRVKPQAEKADLQGATGKGEGPASPPVPPDSGLQNTPKQPSTTTGEADSTVRADGELPAGAIKGMTWQQVRQEAEALIEREGFPGRMELARRFKCDVRTVGKAIDGSEKLKTTEEAYKQEKVSKPKVVTLSDMCLIRAESKSVEPSDEAAVNEVLCSMSRFEIIAKIKEWTPIVNSDGSVDMQELHAQLEPCDDKALAKTYLVVKQQVDEINADDPETPGRRKVL